MLRRQKHAGLTLVDLILLLAALVLLVGFLIPALARYRCTAYRMTCGTNLTGIGRAMLIYANDYDDTLPCAGGLNSRWARRTPDWTAPDRCSAFGLAPDGSGGEASVSASLYLLVRYGKIPPKSFVCGGTHREPTEKGMVEFRRGMYRVPDKKAELVDFWDFGPDPTRHVSYAYHVPYGLYGLKISDPPGCAVAADRNPWMDSPFVKAQDFSKFKPDIAPHGGTHDQARRGNNVSHRQDGQNVLFLDCHVAFEKRPYCSVDDDNIYTVSTRPPEADPWGTPPGFGSQPACRKDSLLVNDPPAPPRGR
jgi:prepilin-type processing-associated H-X9-DG protein